MAKKYPRYSLISKLNIFRLVYRSLLFLAALVLYIIFRVQGYNFFDISKPLNVTAISLITVAFVVEMVDRFFPTKTSSMGSQKQFKKNYKPTGNDKPLLQEWWRTLIVFGSWIGLNAVFAVLYYLHIFDEGIMALIALAYSVCDIICILFFCPFQTWMMKNRCCGTCRIYNWDFPMMFTPLIFIIIPNWNNVNIAPFAITLVACSLILLARWEITYKLHPERFTETTNASLKCINCQEKLCAHKKQLRAILKTSREYLHSINKIVSQDQSIDHTQDDPNDANPPATEAK